MRISWFAWLTFLLACAGFFGIRWGLERQRQWNVLQQTKDDELREKLAAVEYLPLKDAGAVLCPGKALTPTESWGPRRFDVEMPASFIDARYEGWRFILRVSVERRTSWADNPAHYQEEDVEVVRGWRVIAPAKLETEPVSEVWRLVEQVRIMAKWLAAIAWAGGILLIWWMRRYRRAIAAFCIAASLTCVLTSALDLNFGKRAVMHPGNVDRRAMVKGESEEIRWKKTIADHPAWFDGSVAMAALALLLRIIPSREFTGKQCPTCGYDLTGNVSGICPECGSPTPQARRRQRLAVYEPVAAQLGSLVVISPDEGEDDSELTNDEGGRVETCPSHFVVDEPAMSE